MMNAILTAAAEALYANKEYRDNITVMYEGINASTPTMIYGRKGWDSTPFQNANGGPLAVAGWLWSEGGCCSFIADLNSDGSATVYRVEFADKSDEDEGIVEGQPVGIEEEEKIDAPEDEVEVDA